MSVNQTEHSENININEKKVLLSRILKYVKNTFFILFIALLITMVFSVLYSRIKKQEMSFLGYRFYTVLSESMKPALKMGSLIAVKPVKPDYLHAGDIIAFTDAFKPDQITSHRIVEIKNNNNMSFVTKGDANSVNDENLVYSNNVIGKVVFHIPYVGMLLNFVKTKKGIILLIIIPGLAVGISEAYELYKCLHETDDNKEDSNHVNEV